MMVRRRIGVRPRAGRVVRILAASTIALVVLAATPAVALNAGESRLVSLVNSSRRSYGVRPVVVATDLAARAHRHSAEMAASGRAYHSSSLPPSSAENVARVHSVDEAHRLFMQSSYHRTNILEPSYTVIGTGVVQRGEWLYVTEIFSVRRVASLPRVAQRSASRSAFILPPPRRPARAAVLVAPARTLSVLQRILLLDHDQAIPKRPTS